MRAIENSRLYPWLLLAPALMFFAIWNLLPLFWMVGMSFYNYSLTLGRPPRFVQFRNYLDYLDNIDLWLAFSRTFTFVFFSVTLTTLLGALIGTLYWGSTRMPGRRLALTLLFSPMILTPAAIGTFFRLNYDPTFGVIGYLTRLITHTNVEYLGTEGLAFAALVAVDVWMWTPFMVLITLAALGSVPKAELEAAEIDRLSLWNRFRHVILPHARFILVLGIILRTIDAFKVTDLVYQLTRGGPGGTTEVIGVMMFRRAFEAFSIGWTSGVAVITLLTAISFTALFLYLLNLHRRKHSA
ncbi:MAG: sugar ABC transporter permease [Verrucomicrobia bacterium]|nr:sugar ABC transporter permease [Verrucomicrobiota bacterium]